MHRNMGQRSLAEAWLAERLGGNRRLEGVNEVVDWSCFERLLAEIHSARTGSAQLSAATDVQGLVAAAVVQPERC